MTQLDQALAYLDQCREEMLFLWETLVRMESPSADPEAIDRLASHLDTYCRALGMETEKFRPEGAGTCLAAATPARHCRPFCCWATWIPFTLWIPSPAVPSPGGTAASTAPASMTARADWSWHCM